MRAQGERSCACAKPSAAPTGKSEECPRHGTKCDRARMIAATLHRVRSNAINGWRPPAPLASAWMFETGRPAVDECNLSERLKRAIRYLEAVVPLSTNFMTDITHARLSGTADHQVEASRAFAAVEDFERRTKPESVTRHLGMADVDEGIVDYAG